MKYILHGLGKVKSEREVERLVGLDVLNHVDLRLVTRSWLGIGLSVTQWDIEQFLNLEDFGPSLNKLTN